MNGRGGILVWLFLAVLLGLAGLAFTWSVGSSIAESYASRTWVKVRAEVLHSEIQQRSLGRTNVFASYRYEIGGHAYESSQLGISTRGEGLLGEWPEAMHDYMRLARDEKVPIFIWVDPDQPWRSLVDRELGVGTLLVMLPLAVLFDLAALGALRAAYRAWREEEGEGTQLETRARDGFDDERDSDHLKILWWIALFMNIIVWPIAVNVLESEASGGRTFAYAVVLLPFVGMWTLWLCVVRTYRYWVRT